MRQTCGGERTSVHSSHRFFHRVVKLSSETALFQEEMARQYDIIIIAWLARQDIRTWSLMEAVQSLTAQSPGTLVL